MKMELRRKALDKLYKRRDRIEMPDFSVPKGALRVTRRTTLFKVTGF